MSQTSELIDTIKGCLKRAKMTYADVARKLEMSEANVKRMFSRNRMTLDRLEQLCDLLGMELTELARQVEQERLQVCELTMEQERALAADKRLLLVAHLLLNHWQPETISEHYYIGEHELMRYLAQLDRIQFIDLFPGNQVRLLVSPHFKWLPGGPVHQFFSRHIERDFFKSRFAADDENLIFMSGMLSPGSNEKLQQAMSRLAR